MGINVTESSFQKEVLEQSKTKPVLVDFWAEWCGPCRMLGPVLEKIEADLGSFILAKIDTDKNQQIANQYKISGIPAVKLFINASVAAEFTGALSEPMVLQFLEKHIPDQFINNLLEQAQSDPIAAAESALIHNRTGSLLSNVFWQASLAGLAQGQNKSEIEKHLKHVPIAGTENSEAANSLRQFFRTSDNLSPALIELLGHLDNEASIRNTLNQLVESISIAENNEREIYRQEILLAFQLIGASKPIVNEYRKKLAQVLF